MNKLIGHNTITQKWLHLLLVFEFFCFYQAHKLILRQPEEKKTTEIGYRLPRHAAPTNYKLRLWPNVTSKTFRGTADIELIIYNPANNVTLHTDNLTIDSVSLENFFLETIPVNADIVADKRQLLIVQSQSLIPDGRYLLKIYFSGSLDGINGLFISPTKNNGTIVASMFEPTFARKAFPCFDEPDFKATFDITIIKPQNSVALSNMNEISKTVDNDVASEAVTFATSVPMSTYLVCFVIGDFDFKETEITSNGIRNNFKLRIYAQKHEIPKTDYALNVGKRALEFYLKYYEVPFPLPKLDMVAIPNYMPSGEENWGLITYNEDRILLSEVAASIKNKIDVGSIISHELAHMWFGNLVTMAWWNDLWLKEGFAQFMEAKCLDAIEPSWSVLDNFLLAVQTSLSNDIHLSSYPIVQTAQTVETPDQISQVPDKAYLKGASIIRMMEGFIGEQNFKKGVSDYLKKHKFSNTVTQDLLASWETSFKTDYPDQNLTYITDTWLKQIGYPLLTVAKEDNTYVITQTQFLMNHRTVSRQYPQLNFRWSVPITFKTDKGISDKVLWFDDGSESVTITLEGIKWLKINNDQIGYYRVNYPLDMWQDLIEQLKSKSNNLSVLDRAHLLSDAFALAEAGAVPYPMALELAGYLPEEEAYVPWGAAAAALTQLLDRLSDSVYDKMQTYIQGLVSNVYAKLNWDASNLSATDRLLRTWILSISAQAKLPAAEEKIRSLFLGWLNSRSPARTTEIDLDIRQDVYYHGMKYASQSDWDRLWQLCQNEDDIQERVKLKRALAAPQNTEILKKYLSLAWDNDSHSPDFLDALRYTSANPWGRALSWDFLREHWKELVERFTLNVMGLYILPVITKAFDTEDRLNEMKAFFVQYPEAGAGAVARARALETARNNIAWRAARAPEIAAWLDDPSF